MKLTAAQQRALDAIVARGFATVSSNYSWYYCDGQKFRYAVVQRLRELGMVHGRAVPAGQPYPDGRVNALRVSVHIVVPAPWVSQTETEEKVNTNG